MLVYSSRLYNFGQKHNHTKTSHSKTVGEALNFILNAQFTWTFKRLM